MLIHDSVTTNVALHPPIPISISPSQKANLTMHVTRLPVALLIGAVAGFLAGQQIEGVGIGLIENHAAGIAGGRVKTNT